MKYEATLTASGDVVVYHLSRANLESKLGPLAALQAEQFEKDPRKLLSDFYKAGNSNGPAGVLAAQGGTPDPSLPSTSWFAVYRPCSRDSIAKMLGTTAVGKGLNIKGKSAKKNRLRCRRGRASSRRALPVLPLSLPNLSLPPYLSLAPSFPVPSPFPPHSFLPFSTFLSPSLPISPLLSSDRPTLEPRSQRLRTLLASLRQRP